GGAGGGVQRGREGGGGGRHRRIHARRLIALAEVALSREADLPRSRRLAEQALTVLEEDDGLARFSVLVLQATISWWQGDVAAAEEGHLASLEVARALGRKDLEG